MQPVRVPALNRSLPAVLPAGAFVGGVLAVAAVLGPFWSTAIPGIDKATVGRVLLLVAGTAVLVAAIAKRRDAVRPGPLAWSSVIVITLLLAWIAVNARLWGCRCSGDLSGVAELGLAFGIAVVAGHLQPIQSTGWQVAAALGVLLGGLMAVAGLRDLNSALVAPAAGAHTRLEGVYGNPNYLAYAVAFAVPVLVVLALTKRGRTRILPIVLLGFACAVISLTLSRGGMLAATSGALAAGVLASKHRRRAAAGAIAAAAALAAIATVTYPLLESKRIEEDFPARARDALVPIDGSGWDVRATGLIPAAGSRISNDTNGALLVTTRDRGQGASFVLGSLPADETYIVTLEVAAVGSPFELLFGAEDNQLANGPMTVRRRITGVPRTIRLRWRPTADSPNARIYVWQGAGATTARISHATLRRAGVGQARALPLALEGPESSESEQERLRGAERAFVRSRLDGIELGARAFASEPLTGIGWERFPEYAKRRSEFGLLPTHNEYVRFLAELGLPGVGLLMLLGGLIAAGIIRCRDRRLCGMAGGMIVTGAVGLLFVNGLTRSSASLPLALAAGAVVAAASRRPDPAQAEPPSSDRKSDIGARASSLRYSRSTSSTSRSEP